MPKHPPRWLAWLTLALLLSPLPLALPGCRSAQVLPQEQPTPTKPFTAAVLPNLIVR